MGKYANEFEDAIANVPYSTDWFEMRNNVLHVIMNVYYDKMDFFRTFQSTPNDDPDRMRSLVFDVFGQLYMYNEHFESGRIESGQLDKIVHLSDGWNDCVAVVLFSNVVNAPPSAPMALMYYKTIGLHEVQTQLNKG